MGLIKRFVVSEDSMRPTLEPGDALVGLRVRKVRSGTIVMFPHPASPDLWLVKRVGESGDDRFVAVSDNDAPGVVDSRRFGPVSYGCVYRKLFRVPRRLMR